jgi:hypothetical protein
MINFQIGYFFGDPKTAIDLERLFEGLCVRFKLYLQ